MVGPYGVQNPYANPNPLILVFFLEIIFLSLSLGCFMSSARV